VHVGATLRASASRNVAPHPLTRSRMTTRPYESNSGAAAAQPLPCPRRAGWPSYS